MLEKIVGYFMALLPFGIVLYIYFHVQSRNMEDQIKRANRAAFQTFIDEYNRAYHEEMEG